MNQPSNDPSLFEEPHIKNPQLSAEPAEPPLAYLAKLRGPSSDTDDVEHTVWDEPALATPLCGPAADGQLTYASWLAAKQAGWSQGKAWLSTLVVALLSGPWAMLLVLIHGFEFNQLNALMVCVFAPLTQEVCKNAVLLWVVEKRPYFFTAWSQLFFSSVCSATIFVTIWNLLGSQFNAEQTRADFTWQWTGFLFMHLLTSTLAATGLEKIWRRVIFLGERPKLELGSPWFLAAFLVNFAYSSVSFIVHAVNLVTDQPAT